MAIWKQATTLSRNNYFLGGAVLLLVSMSSHAELFKCKGADSKVTYQDTPCVGDAESSTISASKVRQDDAQQASERAQREIEEVKRRQAPPRSDQPIMTAEDKRRDAATQKYLDCVFRRNQLSVEQDLYGAALRRRADAAELSLQRQRSLAAGLPASCEDLLPRSAP